MIKKIQSATATINGVTITLTGAALKRVQWAVKQACAKPEDYIRQLAGELAGGLVDLRNGEDEELEYFVSKHVYADQKTADKAERNMSWADNSFRDHNGRLACTRRQHAENARLRKIASRKYWAERKKADAAELAAKK
ncbi:MAG TPA: hypothetical protein VH255_04410 [Verrucomicrobiae bacterium]|jgi:hypothetical protein|nr:hypothetical protein [Verrucomicrobiae bacterium]